MSEWNVPPFAQHVTGAGRLSDEWQTTLDRVAT
jgi:hypothetical protein